jgi:hypothetical protein
MTQINLPKRRYSITRYDNNKTELVIEKKVDEEQENMA